MSTNDLYIVDNSSEEQSVKDYLKEWCSLSKQMDIATGYLEIGGLLELDCEWQKLDKIRIILGNEVTKRTRDVLSEAAAYLQNLNTSIDDEHEKNEFLVGVPAILDGLKSGKIECRVYAGGKFHAKAYIATFRDELKTQLTKAMHLGDGYALVGSSNFTRAGLTQNIELNVEIDSNVEQLQEWYERMWEQSEDITEAVLKVIQTHCQDYSPYQLYLRSMYEYFKSREETVSEWENHDSVIYKMLSQYQRDGYNSMVEIADRYSGAFLCDGVGLGKTFVGMMLIERFVKKERKNVVLMVPASARVSVWETTIKKYMPEIFEGFYPFKIVNHTDLNLEKNENLMNQIAEQAEVVVIDEAHHFRNRTSNRYKKLFSMMATGPQKQMFMLTATPINNSFLDLQHLIELFTHEKDDYFSAAPLGIHSLKGHFKKMEAELKRLAGTDASDAISTTDDIFRADQLVNQLVVQRSRAYVKQSLSATEGAKVMFSKRQPPEVANYSLEKSYGALIDHFVKSFDRKDKLTGKSQPILALAVYSPYEDEYFIGDKSSIDAMKTGRQQQIVNLIRQLLLKRFESSIAAFEETCIRIYRRLYRFVDDYREYGNEKLIGHFLLKQTEVIEYVDQYIAETLSMTADEFDDDLPGYVWEDEEIPVNENDFNIDAMLDDTLLDMEVLAGFIEDIMGFDSSKDDKIRELKRILSTDSRVKNRKVIIFSEYRSTAQYIYRELKAAGFEGLYEIDGQSKTNRHDMVVRFAPYYNDSSSAEVKDEIQILVATDVLAEGLNLQDAQCLINYDLHWNPVRLMQRIGRIDRRRSAETEERLLADHPELSEGRENAYYWNFLPPGELDALLSLYKTVSQKTLRISKTFGIEGKKLLTPDDDFDALKDFNSQYEGNTSGDEEMALAYQKLMQENPTYQDDVLSLPKKMYSGRRSDSCHGFFFCYELPLKKTNGDWSDGDGWYRWFFYDTEADETTEDTYAIWRLIRCESDESRYMTTDLDTFTAAKKKVLSKINKGYMKSAQVPAGTKPRLVTWIELS